MFWELALGTGTAPFGPPAAYADGSNQRRPRRGVEHASFLWPIPNSASRFWDRRTLDLGANTAIFSVMHAVLLRMLPVRDPQQLFYLTHEGAPDRVGNTGDYRYTLGINVYKRMREERSVFSDLIAYVPLAFDKVAARYGDTPEEIEADQVSGNFFSALGVRMAAGQPFAPVDEARHSQVAVISYGYWTRRFARDPSVIGQAFM